MFKTEMALKTPSKNSYKGTQKCFIKILSFFARFFFLPRKAILYSNLMFNTS